jgi:hypothetical protein
VQVHTAIDGPEGSLGNERFDAIPARQHAPHQIGPQGRGLE